MRFSKDFEGLVAIVTGGASGIGAAVMDQLSEMGATAVALDMDTSSGGVVSCDVTDRESVDRAVEEVVNKHGRLDVVINNAGIGAQGGVEEISDADFARVMEVNVLGIMHVAAAALPYLRSSTSAAIVNTGSIAGHFGLARRALYSASKGAVHALTLAMAADHLHEGIRVNCVAPGTADTPWVNRLLAVAEDAVAERAALEARQPHGRLVSADEVASAIVHLALPGSGSTTGVILAVDGGATAFQPAR